MPEEILYCPSCNNKLRIPSEMLGDVVQCPLCNLVFATPRGAGRPAAQPGTVRWQGGPIDETARQNARRSLRIPAIALLIGSFLGGVFNLYYLGVAILYPDVIMQEAEQTNQLLRKLGFPIPAATPDFQQLQVQAALISSIIFSAINVAIILAAVKMLQLRMFSLALTGSILALVNCGQVCCLLTAPFGLWAMIVLARADVRSAFE